MPGKRKPSAPAGQVLPSFERVPLAMIAEPTLPARVTMNDAKMLELIESFRDIGQLEPITVEKKGPLYEIITGHRRFLAARQLQWPTVAAMVYAEGSAQVAAMMLHENIVRESLNPADEALYMAQCREKFELDEAGLVKMFHRSADYIAGRFALLRGDADVFSALQRGELRLGVSQELNRIGDETMRRYYLDLARRSDPSARVVHGWVEQWSLHQRPPLPMQPGDAVGVAPGPEDGGQALAASGAAGPTIAGQDGGPPPFFGCELCGGDRDPYNLVNVRVHKHEWELILAQVAKATRGE